MTWRARRGAVTGAVTTFVVGLAVGLVVGLLALRATILMTTLVSPPAAVLGAGLVDRPASTLMSHLTPTLVVPPVFLRTFPEKATPSRPRATTLAALARMATSPTAAPTSSLPITRTTPTAPPAAHRHHPLRTDLVSAPTPPAPVIATAAVDAGRRACTAPSATAAAPGMYPDRRRRSEPARTMSTPRRFTKSPAVITDVITVVTRAAITAVLVAPAVTTVITGAPAAIVAVTAAATTPDPATLPVTLRSATTPRTERAARARIRAVASSTSSGTYSAEAELRGR